MKNKWLLQTSGFKNTLVFETFEAFKKLKFNCNDFGITDNGTKITNLDNILEPDIDNYIVRGGVAVVDIMNKINSLEECNNNLTKEQLENEKEYIKKLKKSINFDEPKFNQYNYKDYDLPLLNKGALYIPYEEAKNLTYNKDMFIKPSRDLKAFSGNIMPIGTSVKEFILNSNHQSHYKEEIIVLNETVEIYSEYRFFIVDNKVITGSMYTLGGKLVLNKDIPSYILNKAKEYCKLYNPSDIFVMDLAETKHGIYIVEYNCWNASGLYHSNMLELFNTIDEYKS